MSESVIGTFHHLTQSVWNGYGTYVSATSRSKQLSLIS